MIDRGIKKEHLHVFIWHTQQLEKQTENKSLAAAQSECFQSHGFDTVPLDRRNFLTQSSVLAKPKHFSS